MPQTASKRRNLLAACKDTSKLGCDPAKKPCLQPRLQRAAVQEQQRTPRVRCRNERHE